MDMRNGGTQAPQDGLASLLGEYHTAKTEFDNACHRAAEAQQHREKCDQELRKLSAAVDKAVAHGLNDPTVPVATCATLDKKPFRETEPARY